ncbi:MAG: branched-chain amino acid ABC transporter permease [Hyphomicrobiaceae bacterium]|nr:branched-chain amino acid ABC transporter permease [Hyphomicrobiaceae bacterium]
MRRRPLLLEPTFLASIVVVLILPVVLPSVAMATEALIFVIASLGCTLLLGYVGLLSFGQAIFFGVGAYACGLALIHLGASAWGGLLAAAVISLAAGLVVGGLVTQRRGIYFVMLTLACSQMFYFIAYAMEDITGGDNGLLNVPRPPLLVFETTLLTLRTPMSFYTFAAIVFLCIYLFLQRLVSSPFGSALVAVRENEDRALAMGYNTRLFKIAAFAISAVVTGIAGALYALFLNFAPLSNIEVSMGERIIIMTILGGTGSLFGSVLGGTFYVLLGNLLSAIWPRWLLVLGLILIVVASYLRGGLLSGVNWIVEKGRGWGILRSFAVRAWSATFRIRTPPRAQP